MTIPEQWRTESGLLDDVDAKVVKCEFGFLEEYKDEEGNQVPLALFYLQSPDADVPDDKPSVIYSLGKGWEIKVQNGVGVSVRNPKRPKAFFNERSRYGMLITRVVGQDKEKLDVPGLDNLDPRVASTWIGFNAHWLRQQFDFGDGFGGSQKKVLMPTAFLGWEKSGRVSNIATARAQRPAAAAAPTPPPETQAEVADDGAGADAVADAAADAGTDSGALNITPVTKARLDALMRKHRNRTDFQSAALDLDAIASDAAVSDHVLSDDPDGYWSANAARLGLSG